MMPWLLNRLKVKISGNVMFLITAKEMWDTLKVMYGNKKSLSRVFEIYERLFKLKQGDNMNLSFTENSRVLINDLEMHQFAVTDASTH